MVRVATKRVGVPLIVTTRNDTRVPVPTLTADVDGNVVEHAAARDRRLPVLWGLRPEPLLERPPLAFELAECALDDDTALAHVMIKLFFVLVWLVPIPREEPLW